jgi:cytoskeletal protein RodZ
MDNQLAGENRILWSRVIGAFLVAALIVGAIWFVFFRPTDKKQTAAPQSSKSSGQSQQPPANTGKPNPAGNTAPGSSPSGSSSSTPPASSTPAAPKPSNSSPAPSQPHSAAHNTAQLSNTGPGDVVKLFVISTMAAAAGHHIITRRRQVRL